MLKIIGKSRLTRAELEDIKLNSGITRIQYEILRLKYFDENEYSVVKICDMLTISETTYECQLKKAIAQVVAYYALKETK